MNTFPMALKTKPLKRRIRDIGINMVQSLCYYFFEKKLLQKDHAGLAKHIVFVCKGNICRSVFAEMRAKTLGRWKFGTVESCGLNVDQGTLPPPEAISAARQYSCNLEGRPARSINTCNIEKADLILAMEYCQYRRLVFLLPHRIDRIKLLRTFAPMPYRLLCNITDPYGWGAEEFARSYRLIDKSIRNLA